jgi:hypothetical protein
MRFPSKALVAATLLVLLTACGKKAEDESAATQPAEQPTRTAEAPGTTTNFEDQQAAPQQEQQPKPEQ